MIVDDEAGIREAIVEYLNRFGYSTDSADSVQMALGLIGSNVYDVIITDKNMPDEDGNHEGGMTLLRQVKAQQPAAEIIMMTGFASVETAIDLTDQTDRVILLTPEKTVVTTPDLEKRLEESNVKLLTESRLLEIRGEFEVEKVLIFNIVEDEEYELFVDAVVIIE